MKDLEDEADLETENVKKNGSTTTSPNLPQGPEWRADVGRGKWKAPLNNYGVGEEVYIKKKPRGLDGPWTITKAIKPTRKEDPDWKYDLRHADGGTRTSVKEDNLG